MAKNIKSFYQYALLFWFVLLALAFVNAAIRETTYKPLLEPYIGYWAHQISSLTEIIFFLQTYYFRNGETWIFVLISLIISPLIIYKRIKKEVE